MVEFMLCVFPPHTESKTSEAFIPLTVSLFTQNFVAQHLYTSKTFKQLCYVKYQHNCKSMKLSILKVEVR